MRSLAHTPHLSGVPILVGNIPRTLGSEKIFHFFKLPSSLVNTGRFNCQHFGGHHPLIQHHPPSRHDKQRVRYG